jgi:hypothetical protein
MDIRSYISLSENNEMMIEVSDELHHIFIIMSATKNDFTNMDNWVNSTFDSFNKKDIPLMLRPNQNPKTS